MKKAQADIASLLDLHSPQEVPGLEPLQVWEGPLLAEVTRPHPPGCWCITCFNAGLRYGEHLKAKRLQEI